MKDLNLEKVTNDIINLCASDIMRHSMQYFMKGFNDKQRYEIAKAVAYKSYIKALSDIEEHFNS